MSSFIEARDFVCLTFHSANGASHCKVGRPTSCRGEENRRGRRSISMRGFPPRDASSTSVSAVILTRGRSSMSSIIPTSRFLLNAAVLLGAALLFASCSHPTDAGKDWPHHGGTTDEPHFSPLQQISQDNVGRLGLSWFY